MFSSATLPKPGTATNANANVLTLKPVLKITNGIPQLAHANALSKPANPPKYGTPPHADANAPMESSNVLLPKPGIAPTADVSAPQPSLAPQA